VLVATGTVFPFTRHNSSFASKYAALPPLNRTFLALFAVALLGQAVHSQNRNEAAPSEVKETVDAFLAHWTMTGAYREPNRRAPLNLTSTMDCALTFVTGRKTTEPFTIGIPGSGKMTMESIEEGAEGKSTMELIGARR